MSQLRNLWGEIGVPQDLPNLPQKILKEQAEILTKQSSGILIGQVVRGVSSSNNIFSGHLRIVVPALGHYIYNVLKITYPIEKIYPVTLTNAQDERYECQDVDEYEQNLEKILSSEMLMNMNRILRKF